MIRVATLEELTERGVMVVRGTECPIAVFAHNGTVAAVDNRCPHLGFPLHRGSVQDGILTCHWHHARFDLCSGCTFDLFADDAPSFAVEVRDGEVWLDLEPKRGAPQEYYRRRLRQGLETNIGLVQAKSLLGLLKAGVPHSDIVREIALFGVTLRGDWGTGLTLLAAVANLLPQLSEETAYLALYQATRQIGVDCANQPARRALTPLDSQQLPASTLKRWMIYWTQVRHRDGAERTLLTAIHNQATPAQLVDLLMSAATLRPYANGGHLVDFCNKAFELLDVIGWEHAAQVLPTLMPMLVNSRGGEETNSWRHPTDLLELLQEFSDSISAPPASPDGESSPSLTVITTQILGDDPRAILTTLARAREAGCSLAQLAQAVTYAAAWRVAHFGTANEMADWLTALHTFSYCNAVAQIAVRGEKAGGDCAGVWPGILHGALSIYLDRFLNVPPASLPNKSETGAALPDDLQVLGAQFLALLDQRHEVDAAARFLSQCARAGKPPVAIFDVLARATLREDLDFHATQMLEAAWRQYTQWQNDADGANDGVMAQRDILIAAARYLAAHCPTQRARLQTAEIALRLHRGDDVYEDDKTA